MTNSTLVTTICASAITESVDHLSAYPALVGWPGWLINPTTYSQIGATMTKTRHFILSAIATAAAAGFAPFMLSIAA